MKPFLHKYTGWHLRSDTPIRVHLFCVFCHCVSNSRAYFDSLICLLFIVKNVHLVLTSVFSYIIMDSSREQINNISERVTKSRLLLNMHAGHNIIFSDEKLFTLEETLKKQNDRIYGACIRDITADKRTVERYQNTSAVMVWGARPKGSFRYFLSTKAWRSTRSTI